MEDGQPDSGKGLNCVIVYFKSKVRDLRFHMREQSFLEQKARTESSGGSVPDACYPDGDIFGMS